MGCGSTWMVIQEWGMPGKAFPTLDHPPRYVLMGGEHPGKPSDGRKMIFPTAVAPEYKPEIVDPPHQPIIYLGPEQWAQHSHWPRTMD